MADDFVVELRVDLTGDITGQLSRQLGQANTQFTGFDQKVAATQKTLAGAAGSSQKLAASLSTTRYALYDVSSTLAITGAALLGIAVATTAVAIAWERDFANVARTSGAVGTELDSIRTQLVDLAQTLPVAFGDVTKIATLGAQLGIANEDLTEFTQTVVKFSAATGISAEESAQAFGRLGNILGVTSDQYDNLGSSIVKAGISAVATESEIVAVAQQIGPIARLAGASAEEVIGLSTAFASVKIPPELARSVVTKTFGDIERAVAGGGAKLEAFGKALGVSGQQFAAAWKKDSTNTFVELLEAIPKDGTAAIQTLDGLGLSSQRNTPALQKLAQNTQLVRQSLREAGVGFAENTELNRQFGIISETTAARLQVLANNFQAFLDAVGSANLGALGAVVDALSGMFGALADFAGTDIGGKFLGLSVVITGLLGVLALGAGAMALFGASSIGLQQALSGIAIVAPRATGAILGTAAASAAASGSLNSAALAARGLVTVLKLLAAATVVLALPDIAGWANDAVDDLKDFDHTIGEVQDRVTKTDVFYAGESAIDAMARAADNGTGFMNDFNRAMANVNFGTAAAADVKRFDDQLVALIGEGKITEVKRRIDETGLSASQLASVLPETSKALETLGPGSQMAADSAYTVKDALAATAEQAQMTEDELNGLKDAILNFADTSISAEEAEIAFKGGLQEIAAGVADATIGLDGSNAASLNFIQSLIDMDKSARDSAVAIIENGGSIEEAGKKYDEARAAIVEARIAKGEDADAANAWADRVLGTADEAKAAIGRYADEVNQLPARKDITIGVGFYAYGDPLAIQAIQANGFSTTGANRVNVGQYATGGPVYGPGTGTSDSILARLSNNEFVMTDAAHDYYGTAFLNAINQRKLPKFASGGPVSGGSSGAAMMGGVVELGPRSLSRLSQSVTNNIMLDDAAISRAAQRGDAYRRSTGEL